MHLRTRPRTSCTLLARSAFYVIETEFPITYENADFNSTSPIKPPSHHKLYRRKRQ